MNLFFPNSRYRTPYLSLYQKSERLQYFKDRPSHFLGGLGDDEDDELAPTATFAFDYYGVKPNVARLRPAIATTVMRLRAQSAGGLGLTTVRFDGRLVAVAAAVTGQAPLIWCLSDDPEAEEELDAIVSQSTSATAMCLRVLDQLGRRRVTNRYFPEVRRCVARISDAWRGLDAADAERRHRLSLQLVCRLMFVRFVEQKGWLDNDRNFLTRLLLDPDGRDLFATRVRPLFFDALNRPRAERDSGPLFAAVPFLNGGLFAPTVDELECPELALDDTVIREVFERLFVRWRFVSSARVHGCDAINPEMLGAIFERLMDADERAATGTWYTPAALVAPMVKAAITEALKTRLKTPLDLSLRTGEGASEALACISRFCVLDPAVGSGAFLLGALEELAQYRVTLSTWLGTPETLAQAKRFVVSRNLYGVDISATAVGLAELRLWLDLASTMPDGPGDHIVPLPNLGHHLRHGDALISPWQAAWSRGIAVSPTLARQLRDAGAALASASGATKYLLERRIHDVEAAIASDLSGRAREAIAARIAALRSPGRDLLGQARVLSPAQRRELAEAEQTLAELARNEGSARAAGHGSAFDVRLHFSDVMDAGGFDAIVGNPPWVRLADLPAERRALLRAHYRWVAEAGAGRAFGAQADLAVAFVERALQLTRNHGVVHLLIPSKLFTAGFGGAMRHELLARHELIAVAEEQSDAATFAADVYPARLFFRKGGVAGGVVSVQSGPITLDTCRSGELLVEAANPRAAWSIRSRSERDLLLQICDAAPTLAELFTLRLGIKTGANDVFLNAPDEVGPRVAAIRGRDIGAFCVLRTPSMPFAYDTVSGVVQTSLNDVSEQYFAAHRAVLEARRDADPRLPLWQLFRVRGEALGHRVVWRDMSLALQAVALEPVCEGGPIALNSAYTLQATDRAQALRIAAWLNTDVARLVARTGSDAALGGYRRFFASNVGRVAVPEVVRTGRGRSGTVLTELGAALAVSPGSVDALAALNSLACELVGVSPEAVQAALLS